MEEREREREIEGEKEFLIYHCRIHFPWQRIISSGITDSLACG